MTAEIANRTIATKKMSFAISTAVPAMPPNPNTAATRATRRKVIAQPSMVVTSLTHGRTTADLCKTTSTVAVGSATTAQFCDYCLCRRFLCFNLPVEELGTPLPVARCWETLEAQNDTNRRSSCKRSLHRSLDRVRRHW